MQINMPVFYALIIFICALLLLIIFLLIIYLVLAGKYLNLRSKVDEEAKGERKLAYEEAKRITDSARQEAGEIMASAGRQKSEYVAKLEQEVSKSIQSYALNYRQGLENINGEVNKVLSSITKDINNRTNDQIEKFSSSLAQELAAAQERMRQTVEHQTAGIQTELENHKNLRIQQIDAAIIDIIKDVSEKVLAKEITVSEHEKLVMRALQQAKITFGLDSSVNESPGGEDNNTSSDNS